ncbi:MAG: hypothetical protein ABW166_03365 [Sedimenticola sp.]
MEKTGYFYRAGFIATSLLCLVTSQVTPVQACGWWGDGDVNRDVDTILTSLDGTPLPQTLSTQTAKLPGRMGYGIAMPDPGRAIPYLQATNGRPINQIGELKIFGFKTVIDLGTAEKTAKLHRQESEALGMRYFNIPVVGAVPSQEQVEDFSTKVVAAGNDMLLVYAPNAELLGTMWAAYRINMGAPVEFAIGEGTDLGMRPDQAASLRKRSHRRR